MPSHRKRIGFLPSEEVHEIIEKLCNHNKYSQSKVTGILVEEALRSRGALNVSLPKNNNDKSKNSKFDNHFPVNLDLNHNSESLPINKKNLKDDLKIINEYIEFKFFKKIMSQNDNKFD